MIGIADILLLNFNFGVLVYISSSNRASEIVKLVEGKIR
jgi:hypothetical protein